MWQTCSTPDVECILVSPDKKADSDYAESHAPEFEGFFQLAFIAVG